MIMIDSERQPVGRLHVIVDSVALAEAALDGSAPVVQVRVKSGSDRSRFQLTRAIVERCVAARTQCIVNDRVDLALAAGAQGVHLGADDLPVFAARQLAPAGFVIGFSALAPTASAALALISEAATHVDYIGIGPVYATLSKSDIPEPMGEAELAEVARRCDLPLIAISGITPERVPAVRNAGVQGVAVIGAVSQAPNPARAVTRLRELLDIV
jgi:thiamine-phosphate pyrophosphorylase